MRDFEKMKRDPQLRHMRALRDQYSVGSEERVLINRAIVERKTEMFNSTTPNKMRLANIACDIPIHDEVSKSCECGAKHTSNPGWHMNYCPMKE